MVQLMFKLFPTALGEDTNWLHALCLTVAITMDALQAALDETPTDEKELKLSAKDSVGRPSRSTHARRNRRLVHRAA